MAERSTAAVDVAAAGGSKPLTTGTAKATTDGTRDAGGTDAHKDASRTEARSTTRDPKAPELHSGHKLAKRYRLEECVTRLEGFSSWRAVDEKLRRAVGVHILPAEHPRSRPVLAAARSAALLGDPRFVQVLDAVEENELVYVVHEWLPDATELSTVLAAGPMEPYDAFQLVSQVSQAMATAHREGLAHLRLNPGSVLRTSTGQYRIRGLAVMAALRGISPEHPQRTDTEAIGALLYAALTQRWPYESNAHGLPGLPKGTGLIAPDQVRAGVHRGLSELAMRALVNNGATASRQEKPCATPEELAKAVAAMPRIRPPEPSFATPPGGYQRTTYQPGAYGQPPSRNGHPQPAPVPPPPPLQSRTGRALKWCVSALLIAALGLGSWQLADALLREGDPSSHSQSDNGEGEKKPAIAPLPIKEATEFSPKDSPMAENKASLTVDNDQSTGWYTGAFYNHSNFGNLPNRKQGSGIIVDLGSIKNVTGVDVTMYSGQTIEVLGADSPDSRPTDLSGFKKKIIDSRTAGAELKANAAKPVKTRYVLIHITDLPPDPKGGNGYRGGINEIKVLGY
ncbi:protein kinase family protein [Streptomyces sp. UNOC14_S4]|uniref:protein kinase family protein n=1 Tax=Streptomyces sp. UNOC14_S4 TaxID=2872340 RepID=UPI001E541AFA|nr:protein kinase family protein [Streptomyces sp. UNOC14_S4]MCC3766506.1 protein kinase family protein [Streptomyces sp. UNOC14_S4]